jgi:hypothetical protein
MAIYTFYPCKADGGANSLDAAELASDGEARVRALQVLARHSSCSHVVVWCGDREVMRCERDARGGAGAGAAAPGRPPPACPDAGCGAPA